jgi:phosphatidylserine/phosphatidylglycerophosphate/cardiolipin synthase-like enzyme
MCHMAGSPAVSSRSIRAKLLVDGAHYDELIARAVAHAEVSVWIATANLKTMMVEAPIGSRARARGRYVSFFETLGELARRGVDVCILHASPPSGPLQRELARLAKNASGIQMRRCPRVHLKMIVVDGRLLYLGSANLTGAGLGAKGDGRRNFEMGIVTDSEAMLDAAQARFDRLWRGRECGACTMRRACDKPLDLRAPATKPSAPATKPSAPATKPSAPAPKPSAPAPGSRVTSRGSSRPACRSPSAPRSSSSRRPTS